MFAVISVCVEGSGGGSASVSRDVPVGEETAAEGQQDGASLTVKAHAVQYQAVPSRYLVA